MMNPVGWFEIPVEDMDRAKTFYAAVFETEFQDLSKPEMGMHMFAFPWKDGAPQAAGALVKHAMYKPSMEGVRIYFTAPNGDINATLERVTENGGKVLQPEMSIGEHGFIAIFVDTEGNAIAIHRRA